ncbi:hypothetical protein N9248_02405, partial [bacterium]|nr:hypothetical protein [bacterium]
CGMSQDWNIRFKASFVARVPVEARMPPPPRPEFNKPLKSILIVVAEARHFLQWNCHKTDAA